MGFIFLFKICLDLEMCAIVRFNRIKISLKILRSEALSETWAEIFLEPSPVGEMKPSQGLVPVTVGLEDR